MDIFTLESISKRDIFYLYKNKEFILQDNEKELWTVTATGKARKQKEKLPLDIQDALYFLISELQQFGPERSW